VPPHIGHFRSSFTTSWPTNETLGGSDHVRSGAESNELSRGLDDETGGRSVGRARPREGYGSVTNWERNARACGVSSR
jgi:hypothetical protein